MEYININDLVEIELTKEDLEEAFNITRKMKYCDKTDGVTICNLEKKFAIDLELFKWDQ